MPKKALAGWVLLFILSLSLVPPVVIGGPNHGTQPGTKGLPSQTDGQTTREGEGSRTQEKAGGNRHGESDGGLQGGAVKSFKGATGQPSGNDGTVTDDGATGFLVRISNGLMEEVSLSGKGAEQGANYLVEWRNQAAKETAEIMAADSWDKCRGTDSSLSSLGPFLITAYTAGRESTGKRPGDKGYGVTATGTTAHEGQTISADWGVLPPGTVVEIGGMTGYYVVEDKGGGIRGKHIDLFISDLKAALEWGRQYREIRIVEG